MFTVSYFTEKYTEAYNLAHSLYKKGDYAEAGKLMKDAEYYYTKVAESLSGKEREEAYERVERLREMALVLMEKASEEVREAPVTRRDSRSGGAAAKAAQNDSRSEENPYFTFIPANRINVTFDDVVGLDEAKRSIREYVIYPRLYPDKYNYNFMSNKGIMLEGPPGTGKSSFAKAVAHEIKQPFALIKMSSLVDCYVGETSKHIDELFAIIRDYAKKNNCGITVFFDEFDEIAKRRGGDDKASEAAVPALLRNLDGLLSDNSYLLIANTNHMDKLDPAVVDRFSRRINVGLPEFDDRLVIFEKKTPDIEPLYAEKVDWEKAAELTEGMSGRDITFICDELKYYLSGMKAGINPDTDLNEVLAEIIAARRIDRP